MNHEQRFWSGVASRMSPGWKVNVWDSVGDGASLSQLVVRVYGVDVKTGWMMCAGLSEEQARAQAAPELFEGMDRVDAVNGAAALSIRRCADGRVGAENHECVVAMQCAWMALQATGTHAAVVERGQGLRGHWVLLLYSLKNGEHLVRPVFASDRGESGLMSQEEVMQAGAYALTMDLGTKGSKVGEVIKDSGGMVVAEELQRIVAIA